MQKIYKVQNRSEKSQNSLKNKVAKTGGHRESKITII